MSPGTDAFSVPERRYPSRVIPNAAVCVNESAWVEVVRIWIDVRIMHNRPKNNLSYHGREHIMRISYHPLGMIKEPEKIRQ